MFQPAKTLHTTINGQPYRFNRSWATPSLTNEAMPLTCGHRHELGDTIWFGRPADETTQGETLSVCTPCVERVTV